MFVLEVLTVFVLGAVTVFVLEVLTMFVLGSMLSALFLVAALVSFVWTPFDVETSSQKAVWDVTGRGIPDYNRLNTERLGLSHGLDIRVDKTWYLGKMTLNVYLYIQNIYNFDSNQIVAYLDLLA